MNDIGLVFSIDYLSKGVFIWLYCTFIYINLLAYPTWNVFVMFLGKNLLI